MRFLIAAVILGTLLPAAEAKDPKSVCKDRCETQYKFCLNRAITKKGKAECKLDRKNCKGTCGK